MISGMDQLAETELHEAMSGLGNWHKVEDKKQYLANKDECMTCLKDLLIALRQDSSEQGFLVHLKLGEWKVLPEHLIPLFAAYREDRDIANTLLKVLVELTNHVAVHDSNKFVSLQCLQDYKEAFVKKDIFIILMGMLVESMEEDEETQQRGDGERNDVFQEVLTLMCNLMSVPDPSPGDAGYTPMKRSLQLSYIRHFHDEGVLDFFLLFAEQLEQDRNAEQVWSLLEILYHIVAQIDPEGLMHARKAKAKTVLADLLERDQAHARINRTQSTRHSRFGFTMQSRDALGGISNSASMVTANKVNKGSMIYQRDFKNKVASGKKDNMFCDPFFVDLEEGSVRDHNQINPHVKQSLDAGSDLGEAVLGGLRKFFEEFVQTSFSSLVSFARGTVLQSRPAAGGDTASSRQWGRQRLLNFISWVLEFHRHHYFAEVAKCKLSKEPAPTMDIASIQGAIDLDMIQFVTARLREYGKEAHIHSSFLVIVLRALSQQVKTIGVVVESLDSETRDCGEILTQNIVKEDVMANLVWIMKNFKSSAHDPRVLSYTVEVFHHMVRLMKKITERHGASKAEFHVERVFGAQLRRAATSVTEEIASLADAAVVENLFHLLEKYKRHSTQLNSMLVKLIYSIIRADPPNIVVFFELSYFVRINRIWSDPLVKDRQQGKKYAEMIELLRFILRQFFKCAERNRCVFVELLFRKTFEKPKDAMMETRQSEFQAILDNYEDEGYAQFLERMKEGASFETMRARARQLQDGTLPWTMEEDAVLVDRYSVFMDHPLCMELLAAELPEDSRRNSKGVKKRLVELGLIAGKDGRPASTSVEADAGAESSPAKRQRLAEEAGELEMDMDMPMFEEEDIEALELDLEKMLDAEESRRVDEIFPSTSKDAASSGVAATALDASTAPATGVAETALDGDDDTQPGLGLDLELELEAMIDDSGSFPQEETLPASQAEPPASGASATLEDTLAGMLEANGVGTQPTQPSPAKSKGAEEGGDDDAQFWVDAVLEGDGATPPPSQQQQGAAPEVAVASQGSDMFSQDLEAALESLMD